MDQISFYEGCVRPNESPPFYHHQPKTFPMRFLFHSILKFYCKAFRLRSTIRMVVVVAEKNTILLFDYFATSRNWFQKKKQFGDGMTWISTQCFQINFLCIKLKWKHQRAPNRVAKVAIQISLFFAFIFFSKFCCVFCSCVLCLNISSSDQFGW